MSFLVIEAFSTQKSTDFYQERTILKYQQALRGTFRGMCFFHPHLPILFLYMFVAIAGSSPKYTKLKCESISPHPLLEWVAAIKKTKRKNYKTSHASTQPDMI